MTVKNQDGATLTRLVAVMQRLLAPGGCPWDREQTFTTLKKYVVEEAYEVVDGIEGLGPEAERAAGPATALGPDDVPVRALREELGDLLLQVVFLAELARSRGWFGPDDVVHGIADKLERRHPHVFGDATVTGSGEVLANWEKIKAAEKQGRGTLAGMPRHLPSLMYAFRLGEKAGNVGFDWPDARGPREKITEELAELDAALASGDATAAEHELGDVLFSVVNLARKAGIEPSRRSRRPTGGSKRGSPGSRRGANAAGRAVSDHAPDELESYWNEAKREAAGEG